MRYVSPLLARAREPTTYAGISSLALTISYALHMTGTARYVALGAAGLGAVVAILKAEGDTTLATKAEMLEKVLPEAVNIGLPLAAGIAAQVAAKPNMLAVAPQVVVNEAVAVAKPVAEAAVAQAIAGAVADVKTP